MIGEIYNKGEYVCISIPAQTIEDKREIVKRCKTTIKYMWDDRKPLWKELLQLKKRLQHTSKRNAETYRYIKNQVDSLTRKVNRRENIIHDQIDMLRREQAWILHLKQENKRIKELREANRMQVIGSIKANAK